MCMCRKILWVILPLFIFSLSERSLAGYFEWEPFRTVSFDSGNSEPSKDVSCFDSLKPLNAYDNPPDYKFSFSQYTDMKEPSKDNGELEFDFRRFKFSLSHTVTNLDHSIRTSDLEKNRDEMIQSLASALQNSSSYPAKFEALGKVFEPKISLRIEF